MVKPLYIFDMGDGDRSWWKLRHNYRYKPLSHRLGMGLGPERMRRDVGKIQQELIDTGDAVWLDEPGAEGELMSPRSQSGAGLNEELKATTEAVRRLLPPR